MYKRSPQKPITVWLRTKGIAPFSGINGIPGHFRVRSETNRRLSPFLLTVSFVYPSSLMNHEKVWEPICKQIKKSVSLQLSFSMATTVNLIPGQWVTIAKIDWCLAFKVRCSEAPDQISDIMYIIPHVSCHITVCNEPKSGASGKTLTPSYCHLAPLAGVSGRRLHPYGV